MPKFIAGVAFGVIMTIVAFSLLDTSSPEESVSQEERSESVEASNSVEVAQFDISRIDCRTSVCEKQAFGYDTNARAAWTIATADIIQQPWHDFRRMSMSTRDPAPGIFAVVLVLAREAE